MLKNEADEAQGRIPPNWGEQRGKYTTRQRRKTCTNDISPHHRRGIRARRNRQDYSAGRGTITIGYILKALPGVCLDRCSKKQSGIQATEKLFNGIPGTAKFRFSHGRHDLTRRDPRLECAAKSLEQSLTRYALELTWWQQAAKISAGLVTYEAAIGSQSDCDRRRA